MKKGFLFIALLFGGAWGTAHAASEAPMACEKNGGLCGCSYGQVLCCDGSYGPRFYRNKSGELVSVHCAAQTGAGAKAARPLQQGQSLPDFKPFTPSQETYWRRSVF